MDENAWFPQFQALGTPNEENWPGHTKLPDYIQFKEYPATPLEDIFSAAGADLIDLLYKMFALDPNNRCTTSEALQMEYFKNKPYPTPGPNLPLPSGIREKTTGATKRKARDGISESGLAKKLLF